MGEPAHGVQTRRERLAFLLTLAVVVVSAALIGYLLGQFVFVRWVGLPMSSGDVRSARVASPPEVGVEAYPVAPEESAPRLRPPAGERRMPPAGAAGSAAESSPPAPAPASPTQGPVVQLGVFGQRANAERTAQAARSEGYPVRIQEVVGPQGSVVYKVQVGPYPSREAAVAARERLRARWPDAFIP